jgi:glycosyltransferase involved in cell wall biosynthesis
MMSALNTRAAAQRPIRVAVICDFPEENWPSMDMVAAMLLDNLRSDHASAISATRICPKFARWLGRLPVPGLQAAAFKHDRALNRFWTYPRLLRRKWRDFDLFHVVDHSYSHLVHHLPAGRTIVTCHDLDTFRCILEPDREPRSLPLRAMAGRILQGLRRAAVVTCDSYATRDEIAARGLLPVESLVVVPNGVHPDCRAEPDPPADVEAARMLGAPCEGAIEILHVGSLVARKRIELLLEIIARVRNRVPGVRLVRAGGDFTPAQRILASRLGLDGHIAILPFVPKKILAAVYRRAALVLLPSEVCLWRRRSRAERPRLQPIFRCSARSARRPQAIAPWMTRRRGPAR